MAAGANGEAGFSAEDVAWLLEHAPGEVVVLRPGNGPSAPRPAGRPRGLRNAAHPADGNRVGSGGYRLTGLAGACARFCSVGCSHGGASHTATVRVTERDFRISAPPQLAAGDVRLAVHNRGPDDHEFIVIRRDAARASRSAATA